MRQRDRPLLSTYADQQGPCHYFAAMKQIDPMRVPLDPEPPWFATERVPSVFANMVPVTDPPFAVETGAQIVTNGLRPLGSVYGHADDAHEPESVDVLTETVTTSPEQHTNHPFAL